MHESGFRTNAGILLISDSPSIINLLTIMLRENGYNVRSVSNGLSAKQSALENPPDLFLLKIDISETDGYEICKMLKENEKLADIPIIYICRNETVENKDKIFTSGGVDYLTRPFNINEVLNRIDIHLKLRFMKKNNYNLAKLNTDIETQLKEKEKIIEETEQALKDFNVIIDKEIFAYYKNEEELKKARAEAERNASMDYLTGVLNRRAFSERFDLELERSRRTRKSIGLIMTDIDHFKKINDIYGHQAGDAVLQRFSKCLLGMSRTYDFIARYGGEEFLICLSDTNNEKICAIVERMRHKIEKTEFHIDETEDIIKITASFGVAVCTPDFDKDLSFLIYNADRALYRAKTEGRNNVCVAE
ncbi:MAG: diguanylate cyclase [Spirochaetota bacterium]